MASGPRIGSLCSGYGGLELAVQSVMGGTTAWVSDIDKGACKILARRFPGVPNIGDMTAVDWAAVEPVDLICGGTPCQDLSHAGKRAGMTEGTRSNLWVAMREAIAVIRPRYVVWENVRGAASAEADSDLVNDPRLLAGVRRRPGQPVLRALGRVVGDLSDLGYVGQVRGLRAADVGAPHGRFRYFILATDARNGTGHRERSRPESRQGDEAPADAERGGRDGWSPLSGRRAVERVAAQGSGEGTLLPSPRTSDTNGAGQHGDGGMDLRTAVSLLPTPLSSDAGPRGGTTGFGLRDTARALALLPTPTAADSKASGGSSPSDITLTDAVVRSDLGEQENPRHAIPTEAGPRKGLRDVRGAPNSQEVRERSPRGQNGLPQADALLAEVREQPTGGSAGQPQMAGSPDHAEGFVPGVRGSRAAARTSPRPESGEQRLLEPRDVVCLMPPNPALAGGSRGPCGCGTNWGQYEAAIRRWERVLGRCAPPPTQLGTSGRPRLDARFSEFLMGLPAGWVTDVPGITRNEALRALGNGVVPQQGAAALAEMLTWQVAA